MKLRIVADENMPLVGEYFSGGHELRLLPGRSIGAEDVADADALLVRSVTRVDEKLLGKSRVRFVGSATIGFDHLDTAWLEAHGIAWKTAPGCNADSVAEYVVACLAALQKEGRVELPPQRAVLAGVVGVGNVGRRVAQRLRMIGCDVLLNDPPRAERESDFLSTDLKEFDAADIVCLHTPLVKDGAYPTHHLVGEKLLARMKPGAVLISAGRGEVVDFDALARYAHKLRLCLDVWNPEPEVRLDMLDKAEIASPHIAGYALQAKWRGTSMIYAAAADFFSLPLKNVPEPIARPHLNFELAGSWGEVVLGVVDPRADHVRMLAALKGCDKRSPAFDRLRKEYPVRHEFAFPVIHAPRLEVDDRRVLLRLGFELT